MHLKPKSKPTKKKNIIKKFNPIIYRNNGKHKIKSIELGEEFTLVEFQYRSSYECISMQLSRSFEIKFFRSNRDV